MSHGYQPQTPGHISYPFRPFQGGYGERLPNPHETNPQPPGRAFEPNEPLRTSPAPPLPPLQPSLPQSAPHSRRGTHEYDDCPGCRAEMEEALAASLASAQADAQKRQAEQQELDRLFALSASENDAKRKIAEQERIMLQQAIQASRQAHSRQAEEESRQAALKQQEEHQALQRIMAESQEEEQKRLEEETRFQQAIAQSMREQEEEWKRREDEARSLQAFIKEKGDEENEADYWKFAGHDEAHDLAVRMSKASLGTAPVAGPSRRPLPSVPAKVLPPVPGSSKEHEVLVASPQHEDAPPSYTEAAPPSHPEEVETTRSPPPQIGVRVGSFSSLLRGESSSALPSPVDSFIGPISPSLESRPSADTLDTEASSSGQKAIPGVDYGFTSIAFSTSLNKSSDSNFPSTIQLDKGSYFVLRAYSWKSVLRAMAWYGNTTILGDSVSKLRVEVEFVTPTIPGSGPTHVAICLSLSTMPVKADSRQQDAFYASKGSARRLIHIPRQAPALPVQMVKLAQHLHSAHAFSAACPTSSHIALHSPRDLHHAIERHDQNLPRTEFDVHNDEEEELGKRARLKAKVKRKLGKRAAESKVVDEDLATWITPYSG